MSDMECYICGQHWPKNDRLTSWESVIEQPAMPKARPRVTKNGTHMPPKYVAWAKGFALEAKASGMKVQGYPQTLEVGLSRDRTVIRVSELPDDTTSRSKRLTGDVDNYLGGVMDALQGIAWENDRHIHDGRAYLL